MKWVLISLLVFSAAVGAGVYFIQGAGKGEGIEVDWRLLNQMDYITKHAPTEIQQLEGQRIKIPGFMVPLEDDQRKVTEFLLVPTPQACIHVPPPPPNQMVYVRMKKGTDPIPGLPIWVYGKFKVSTVRSQYGEVSFEMEGDIIEDYR
ncbi:DUF3299 domain-containing protein [Pseudobdellovibrio exovorus]|uniref:Lipoprotein n=1 Tax=Pseudobdellovibrio exovorus JSS TaxID=1184267 RepID=M4VAN7_9BACT|nr:DUF3299 domain-containing protein [Pseudobdellovibrio exovorus]AGH95076.1 hypothetical protein A11Q_858 [Pseudobdellovibrio exovorus JSS]